MTLRVKLAGGDYIADVGFGAFGPLEPVPLDGSLSAQADGDYKVEEEAEGTFVLRCRTDAWHDQYAFTLRPALPVDFEVANHFTSTFPRSPFVNTLTVQRSTTSGRHTIRGKLYSERIGGETNEREIEVDELIELLAEPFGLDVAADEARQAFADQK
jgi:N-hydroxyarylamine O-acetyltransferase